MGWLSVCVYTPMSISRWLRTQHPMAHWSKHDRKDCIAIDRVMVAVIMSYCPPNRPAINMSSRVKVDISVLVERREEQGSHRMWRFVVGWADWKCTGLMMTANICNTQICRKLSHTKTQFFAGSADRRKSICRPAEQSDSHRANFHMEESLESGLVLRDCLVIIKCNGAEVSNIQTNSDICIIYLWNPIFPLISYDWGITAKRCKPSH